MEAKELKAKWQSLNPDHITGFRSLRITGESKPDIYVGLDEKGNRCLILRLPLSYKMNIPPSVKENLSLELYPEKKLLVLKLLAREYTDLFDDLVLSLYNKIKDTTDPALYTGEFIQFFIKWSEFFSDKVSDRLSEESIKGLFGEVLILNQLMKDSEPFVINEILEGWRGPYDAVQDFIYEHENIEVKTKNCSVSDVNISSEFQLEAEQGKSLRLIIVDVNKDAAGQSLGDLIRESRDIISGKYGNTSILLKAIFKKGLTFQNMQEYDSFRFMPRFITFYDCVHSAFPKIIRSALPASINTVSYALNVNLLEEFIISKKAL